MQIRKEHLERAELQNALSPGGADSLWANLSQQMAEEPAFKMQHILYYLGAMLMLFPLSIAVSLSFSVFGRIGILLFAIGIGTGLFWLARVLLRRQRRIVAGITATVSLSLVPLALFCLYGMLGIDVVYSGEYASFHKTINFQFVSLEILTLIAGTFYLWHFRLPFLILPVTVILWYFGMDISSAVLKANVLDHAGQWSVFYGLAMLLCAYAVDRRTRHTLADYSFWIWIFGTLTFWGGLSSEHSSTELGKFLYACINLAMILGSVYVGRRVLTVFGGLGLSYYVFHLSHTVFRDTVWFTLFMLVAGGAVIWLGIHWPKIEARMAAVMGVKGSR